MTITSVNKLWESKIYHSRDLQHTTIPTNSPNCVINQEINTMLSLSNIYHNIAENLSSKSLVHVLVKAEIAVPKHWQTIILTQWLSNKGTVYWYAIKTQYKCLKYISTFSWNIYVFSKSFNVNLNWCCEKGIRFHLH